MKIDTGLEWLVRDRFTVIGLQIQILDRFAIHAWFMGFGVSIII